MVLENVIIYPPQGLLFALYVILYSSCYTITVILYSSFNILNQILSEMCVLSKKKKVHKMFLVVGE